MSEERYEVIFRGDVLAGQSVIEVKQRLAQLFNTDAARIDQMFSGKPVVVKRNLDMETAERYQSSLHKAGALVDIRSSKPVETSISTSATSSTENTSIDTTSDQVATQFDTDSQQDGLSETEEMVDFDFDVAPVGADIFSEEHKKNYTPADVDTSHLTVSGVGSDVLEDKDKRSYEESNIDISHLSIDDQDDSR